MIISCNKRLFLHEHVSNDVKLTILWWQLFIPFLEVGYLDIGIVGMYEVAPCKCKFVVIDEVDGYLFADGLMILWESKFEIGLLEQDLVDELYFLLTEG